MPGGNPNNGIGLINGETMFSFSAIYQNIDWYHDPVGTEPDWEHSGIFTSYIINPSISIGITNNFNLSISQIIGLRTMRFFPKYIGDGSEPNDFISTHHRDETSLTDFRNAIGGALGDLAIMGKYIFTYAGMGSGSRIFLNTGILIPSKNYLISDPYFNKIIDTNYGNSDGVVTSTEIDSFNVYESFDNKEHKHFSMSDGLYRFIIEPSFYYKKASNPVFIGLSISFNRPLHFITEKKHSFKGGSGIEAHFTSLFASHQIKYLNKFISNNFNFSIGLSMNYISPSSWDGYISDHTEEYIIGPNFGLIYNTSKYGTFNFLIKFPYYIKSYFQNSNEKNDSNFKQSADEVNFILNYRIPLNYFLW